MPKLKKKSAEQKRLEQKQRKSVGLITVNHYISLKKMKQE